MLRPFLIKLVAICMATVSTAQTTTTRSTTASSRPTTTPTTSSSSSSSQALCAAVTDSVSGCVNKPPTSAINFCSSYLSVPTVTLTLTTTVSPTSTVTRSAPTTTRTAATRTFTTTRVTTVSVVQTSRSVVTILSTATTTIFGSTTTPRCLVPTTTTAAPSTSTASSAMVKRQASTVPQPLCLTRYPSGTALSSACSCFRSQVTTSTMTSTSTVSRAAVTTTVTQTSATVTSTPSTTRTLLSTSTVSSATTVLTTTTSVVTTVRSLPPTFSIIAMGGGIDGLYAIAGNDSDDTTEFSGTNSTASIFDLDSNSYLVQESGAIGYIANQSPSPDIPIVYWNDPSVVQDTDGYTPLTCSISRSADGTCPMTCNGFNGTQNNYCDNFWYLGWPDGAPCANVFNIYAVSS